MRLIDDVDTPVNPLPREEMFAEGNMENISATIPINISVNPDVVENIHICVNCSPKEIAIYTALFNKFCDVFACSYKEILGIDPSIVEHEIRTYPYTKPIWKKLRPVNPHKAAAVKARVEKLLKASFIYPIALREWVSNHVPIIRSKGPYMSVLTLEI